MNISDKIQRLRRRAGVSQEALADALHLTRQAVQKWESGSSVPDIDNIVELCRFFDVSLDYLVRNRDMRDTGELRTDVSVTPRYDKLMPSDLYSSCMINEYISCYEEGLDVGNLEGLMSEVDRLPPSSHKERIADAVFSLLRSAPMREGFAFVEPSDLGGIRELRSGDDDVLRFDAAALPGKIAGAWTGRVAGCMLGKAIEGMRADELVYFLKKSGNYPLSRYVLRSDITPEILSRCTFSFSELCCPDETDIPMADDDTNFTVLSALTVAEKGRDFSSEDIMNAWLDRLPKSALWTAERVAYRNFIAGYIPPQSALYKNPYREWIGGQIRGDYYGYINPGAPAAAAAMAFRDACVSHTKNGVYGAMFVAAMLARAAAPGDISDVIRAGLAQIPSGSRLHDSVSRILSMFSSGASQEACLRDICRRYDEPSGRRWCHVLPNAEIVAVSLLYGRGSFSRSVCIAAGSAFDSDCNGATVGSLLGMLGGIDGIPPEWSAPLANGFQTEISARSRVTIPEMTEMTLAAIPGLQNEKKTAHPL